MRKSDALVNISNDSTLLTQEGTSVVQPESFLCSKKARRACALLVSTGAVVRDIAQNRSLFYNYRVQKTRGKGMAMFQQLIKQVAIDEVKRNRLEHLRELYRQTRILMARYPQHAPAIWLSYQQNCKRFTAQCNLTIAQLEAVAALTPRLVRPARRF